MAGEGINLPVTTTSLPKKLVNKQQAAALLGVSVSTFDRFRKAGVIQPVKRVLKKPLLFSADAITALANGGYCWEDKAPATTQPGNGRAPAILTAAQLQKARAAK